jgi:Helitron helicase-like domain at N-terminus
MRREQAFSNVNVRAKRKMWKKTRDLLQSLSPEDLELAAAQESNHQQITNKAVKELLRLLGQIGMGTSGSDQKKLHMLTELKSSVIFFGLPVIYLTINPADRHSPITLLYAGKKINVNHFMPDDYDYTSRVTTLLDNPLAVVEYFHTMIKTIIDKVLKGGLFGKLVHHYGTIEYQGRYTPHMHMAVSSIPLRY